MANEEIPGWAIEIIRQVERLNEKIPSHIDWVERNIKDHEDRLRNLERRMWLMAGASGVAGALLSTVWQVLNV